MSESKHSPGPWDTDELTIFSNQGDSVAECSERDPGFRAERRANARLIAAAPDLLEALVEMVRQEDEYGEATVHPVVLAMARAAIQKATA